MSDQLRWGGRDNRQRTFRYKPKNSGPSSIENKLLPRIRKNNESEAREPHALPQVTESSRFEKVFDKDGPLSRSMTICRSTVWT